jgi:predicted metal-dependent enzyme (double-stranded beta helix superfamily)
MLRTWIDTLRAEIDAACRTAEPAHFLAARLSLLVEAGGEPVAELTARLDERSRDYSRWLLFQDAGEAFQVLLLHWPVGAQTPVHDHDGLWGVECTLGGELNGEDFQIEPVADGLQLRSLGTWRSAVGQVGVIRPDPGHAHCCWNASPSTAALTLHIYGGALRHCTQYRRGDLAWHREPAKACEARDFWTSLR